MKKQDPKWKKFEKVIAGIHILSDRGALVKFNDHIRGKKTGRKWQVDVSVRFKKGLYAHLVVIECKDLTKKVSIKDVQAFITKVDDLGANKSIMVSASGFQEGAIKAAEVYGVELYTLTEEPGEWLDKIIAPIQSWAFPIHFSIDAKDAPGYSGSENTSLDDFVFYDPDGEPILMRKLIADVMADAVKRRETYPLQVRYQFDQPMQIHLPKFQSPTEAYGVDFEIGDLEIKSESREIPVTPQGINYVYSDVSQQQRNVFPAEELPIGVDTVFEVGKFYKNALDMKYRCLKIEENMASLLLIDWEDGGGIYCVEFRTELNSAQYCVPLNDEEEEKRLEQRYTKLKSMAS